MNGNKTLVRNRALIIPRDLCVYSKESVMFRAAPVRIADSEFDWLRIADTWEMVAARAANIGISTTSSALASLNPDVSLSAAASAEQVGTKVRIRAPWAPQVRTLAAAAAINSPLTMRWNSPLEVWRSSSASAATPELYVRDWNGDGIDELSITAAPGSASVALQILARGANGRFRLAGTLARSGIVNGWVLR
jgi:hypothetical protein